MNDLDAVNSDDPVRWQQNVQRKWLANDVIKKGGFMGGTDLTRVKLDPAVKDKLLTDEARLRKLQDDYDRMQRTALPEIEELDTMQRKLMQGDPRYKKPEHMQDLRRGAGHHNDSVFRRSAQNMTMIDDPFRTSPPRTP